MARISEARISMGESESARIISIYRKRAKTYDWITLVYYFAGFRHWLYRKRAIQCLTLKEGETVVDLGCGTGLNFSLLQQRVGPRGRIIGVDLTDAMLDGARARIESRGWSNVELVKSDASAYVFRSGLDGILSTFALTLVPGFDDVIRKGALSLHPGRRFVVLDFKMPFLMAYEQSSAIAHQAIRTSIRRHSRDGVAKAVAVTGKTSRSDSVHESVFRYRLHRYR